MQARYSQPLTYVTTIFPDHVHVSVYNAKQQLVAGLLSFKTDAADALLNAKKEFACYPWSPSVEEPADEAP